VTTDASRCQQIFGNLAANALKYTPEGGEVRVVGRHGGEHWSVTVTDTGPGIPADSRTKVFEPFYRLPRDERSGSEGHGLGLAICRELVDQMGGTIEVGPAVEPGTLVTVRLPVEPPAHQSQPGRAVSREDVGHPSSYRPNGMPPDPGRNAPRPAITPEGA
jgi:signal transduction histidine kinase